MKKQLLILAILVNTGSMFSAARVSTKLPDVPMVRQGATTDLKRDLWQAQIAKGKRDYKQKRFQDLINIAWSRRTPAEDNELKKLASELKTTLPENVLPN